jgi:hypothetical protein
MKWNHFMTRSWNQSLSNIRREMDVNVVSPAAITASVVGTFKE